MGNKQAISPTQAAPVTQKTGQNITYDFLSFVFRYPLNFRLGAPLSPNLEE